MTKEERLKKFPISEMFYSPQGEGLYTGTQMFFIRFAGCSVGKKMSEGEKNLWAKKLDPYHQQEGRCFPRPLPIYTERCCTIDGREFLCDTDFQTKMALTIPEIVSRIPHRCEHICLTGGEPLMHESLLALIDALLDLNKDTMVHVETSGTIYNEAIFDRSMTWIAVSPKLNALPQALQRAGEIKLLVDAYFSYDQMPEEVKNHNLVFLQPINNEHSLNIFNVKLCLELMQKYPNLRLSTQSHKVWGVR